MKFIFSTKIYVTLCLIALLFVPALYAQETLTFEDVMKFEELNNPVISGDGEWIGFDLWPERGDGEAILKQISGDLQYSVERGEQPQFTRNGEWVAANPKTPIYRN